MSTAKHPPVTTLLPSIQSNMGVINGIGFVDSLGNAIDDLQDKLFGKLRYRDLTIEKSMSGDIGQYRLTLMTEEPIDLALPAGLNLIAFPDAEPSNGSSVDLSFTYDWPIKGYVRDFSIGKNPALVAFEVFLRLAGTDKETFLQQLLDVVAPSSSDYGWLIGKINTWVTTKTWPEPFSLTVADLTSGAEIDEVLEELVEKSIDPYQMAFEAIFEDFGAIDIDQTVQDLSDFFRDLIGEIDRNDIEELLLPHVIIEIASVGFAIEFPANVLRPLDGSAASRLSFTAGGVSYDTKTGFDIALDEAITATLTPSEIGRTGLTILIDGAKLDLSPKYNIPEAIADMRPSDFMGVFFKAVEIGLPEKWFAKAQGSSGPSSTLAIVGRNLLIGTGGLSGTVGLEAIDAISSAPADLPIDPAGAELSFVLGPKSDDGSARKGFALGFSSFHMKFRQNVLLESSIAGSMTIPKFSSNPIGIELFIDSDGDFEVTASVVGGHDFEFGKVFTFKARALSVGKDDGRVYIAATGDLDFSNNDLLKNIIKEPIGLENFRIYSDGSFEIDGGTIPLPESIMMPLGPAKIAITAIHFGSHEQEHNGQVRQYKYWGFDGGISINPGGVDARGDGIKYYFTVDDGPFHDFLRIEGIGIDLVIPGTASKDKAALLLQGYLALKDPEYVGSLSFQLPQVQIAGGASMKYNTKIPAWIVDTHLELPAPIPLAATGLGIYGFRGLFGLRYVAAKSAVGLEDEASWGDYYRAEDATKNMGRGLSIPKFLTPDGTVGAKNPFSIGAGVSLGTATDGAKVFTSQLFLLVSIPSLIMLEGGFDILADERVGLTDEDPPFYAYLALSRDSVELGAGAKYLVPKDTGKVLNLEAVFEAAYFFRNKSAWYVNIGTIKKPTTARIISLFDAYSYLMLSAGGIATGAGVHFDFNKKYGPVRVAAYAYLDLWAYVSFERQQAGGGIALGGSVRVTLFGFGFTISLDAALTVEVPKPFLVTGRVKVCVSVNLKIKKIKKCVTLEFTWDRDSSVDYTPVDVIANSPGQAPPVMGIHMASGKTYELHAGDTPLGPTSVSHKIPLDTYIDVKFAKPVNPVGGIGKIEGSNGSVAGNVELLPPRFGSRIVKHEYTLDDVAIETWSDTKNAWVPYHPFAALAPEAFVGTGTAADVLNLPVGAWQKQDTTFSQIRFLAASPFNYMEPVGGYVPEEMGLSAWTLFCRGQERVETCVSWDRQSSYDQGKCHARDDLLFYVEGDAAAALAVSEPRLAPVSLAVKPGSNLFLEFPQPIAKCQLTLATAAPQIVIRYQRRKPHSHTLDAQGVAQVVHEPPSFEDVSSVTVSRADLASDVVYDDPSSPIERIIVEPPAPDSEKISSLIDQIDLLREEWYRAPPDQKRPLAQQHTALTQQLRAERDAFCVREAQPNSNGGERSQLQVELRNLRRRIAAMIAQYTAQCGSWPPGSGPHFSVVNTVVTITATASTTTVTYMSEDTHAQRCAVLAEQIKRKQTAACGLMSRIDALSDDEERPPQAAGWQCATYLNKVCWFSYEDWSYNDARSSQAAIDGDFDNMRTAIEKTIAPIWRPHQIYRIILHVSDTVTGPSDPAKKSSSPIYVHFKTEGSIGHFVPPASAIELPVGDDGREEIPERSLKYYLDMKRSMPDPSGKLLYAKPLYYQQAELTLYMAKPYAYHFFAEWPAHSADLSATAPDLDALTYEIDIRIKDPAEAIVVGDEPNYAVPLVTAPPPSVQEWFTDTAPRQGEDLKILSAMRDPSLGNIDPGPTCWEEGGGQILPAAKALRTRADLKPNKLYTAVVINRHVIASGNHPEAEIHRYPFKTSRYKDFQSHIDSYKLVDDAGNERLAVFAIGHDLAKSAAAQQAYAAALGIVERQGTANSQAFPDFFDRLVYANLELVPLPPATSLEFNFMRNDLTDEVYGLLIRSSEPLNDPRVPLDKRLSALRVKLSGTVDPNMRFLISKDCCQVFVMRASGLFPTAGVAIVFDHLVFDGHAYTVASTVETDPFSMP